jgi:phosphoglycolate phosphatase
MSGNKKADMIRSIIKKHNIKKAVYIGDTKGDMEAASGAGIDFIQMTYGFDKPLEGATKFKNMSEFEEYILSCVLD